MKTFIKHSYSPPPLLSFFTHKNIGFLCVYSVFYCRFLHVSIRINNWVSKL